MPPVSFSKNNKNTSNTSGTYLLENSKYVFVLSYPKDIYIFQGDTQLPAHSKPILSQTNGLRLRVASGPHFQKKKSTAHLRGTLPSLAAAGLSSLAFLLASQSQS